MATLLNRSKEARRTKREFDRVRNESEFLNPDAKYDNSKKPAIYNQERRKEAIDLAKKFQTQSNFVMGELKEDSNAIITYYNPNIIDCEQYLW